MKGNRIDELFRNGLESHKITAPENAWAKLEAGLPQKSKKGAYFWLSIAATLLLLATIGWLAINQKGASEQTPTQILSQNEPQKEVNEQTTAKNDAIEEISTNNSQVEIEPVSPIKVQSEQIPNLVANTQTVPASLKQEIETGIDNTLTSFELKIEMIRPEGLKPQYLAQRHVSLSMDVHPQFLIERTVLSMEEVQQLENQNKKRFGLISGIVSVAKGVNNGSKAISEMRKSKNEFVNNDLKYGTKTDGTTEGSDDEQDLKQYQQ